MGFIICGDLSQSGFACRIHESTIRRMAALHGLVAAAIFPVVTLCVEGTSPLCFAWLPRMDSNHDKQIQNLQCYRYTTRQ